MQTRILGLVGVRSALTLLCVMSGGVALAQASGTQDGGAAGSSNTSKYADMKVSVDATGERLVVLIPKLFKSVGAEFSIDADVKNALLSSHLTNVKLQTVLDVLLRTSDIPVQYKVEKDVYHFSKRVDPLPEAPPAKPQRPSEPVLPPPPTIVQDDVDVHNVQTYDLLRVLNGLFGVPVAIDPGGDNGRLNGHRLDSGGSSAVGQGSANSHGSTSSGSIGSGGIGGSSGSFGTSANGSGASSQSGSGGAILNIFGHPIRIGNGH